MPSDMGATVFWMTDERHYLDEVSGVVYDYGNRVELLVGMPSEMQLPVDQGIEAAYSKASKIAEACGYTAYQADAFRLVVNLHSGSYVLFWDAAPERQHLLASVTCTDTLKTVNLGETLPELWQRLEFPRLREAN